MTDSGTRITGRLTWRAQRVSGPRADRLRRFAPGGAFAFAADAVVPSAAPGDVIDFPELPEDPNKKGAALLMAAAEVEHALMVQYLYAGYGFSGGSRPILDVAIEEMSHLMTVQNLLRLIGRPPHLHRQDYGPPSSEAERLFPFDLRFEAVSHVSLAKYVVAESPELLPSGVDPVVMERIRSLATDSVQQPINRVGMLYGLLGAVFGSQEKLLELAATGDPWYVGVNDVAAEAAIFYGGRDKLHLPDDAFDPNAETGQGSDRDWDRSTLKEVDEFRIHVVRDREEALESLRDIGLQGEGPSSPMAGSSHFKRFYDLYLEFFGPDGTGTAPPPGVSAAPSGAKIAIDPDEAGSNIISNVATGRWAALADIRYAILLGALELYLRSPPDDRSYLRGWCFAEMSALGKLAEFLRQMPRGEPGVPLVAALPFNLPHWIPASIEWTGMATLFDSSLALIEDIQSAGGVAAAHRLLLVQLDASDRRKSQEAEARAGHSTIRTRADSARDILDWIAGAGTPSHFGDSPPLGFGPQGRFWNLQRDDFVEVSVFGSNIVQPAPNGGDAPLIENLRSQAMPRDRPKLGEDDDELRELARWVADGCPDDPV